MTWTGGHDAGVAEKSTVFAFNGPAAEAMLTVCHCIAVKLGVAVVPADRSSVVMHHHRVSVHGGKCIAVSVFPTTKPRARRDDDHGDITHVCGIEERWHISRTTQKASPLALSRRAVPLLLITDDGMLPRTAEVAAYGRTSHSYLNRQVRSRTGCCRGSQIEKQQGKS